MKLQSLLTEYLVTNSSLPLQGVGQLQIKSNAASLVQADDLLTPPSYRIIFSAAVPGGEEQQKLTDFIGNRLGIDSEKAVDLMNEEASLQKSLAVGHNHFDWVAVGIFQKQENGIISFTQTDALGKYLPDISLEKITKQLVLETFAKEPAIEQTEPVYEYAEPVKKDNWWIWAIVIFVVSVALILIRYYA